MADVKDSSRRIVFTGAAGGIGTMIRPLLAPLYPGLVLSDKTPPKNLLPSETFKMLGNDLFHGRMRILGVLLHECEHSIVDFKGNPGHDSLCSNSHWVLLVAESRGPR